VVHGAFKLLFEAETKGWNKEEKQKLWAEYTFEREQKLEEGAEKKVDKPWGCYIDYFRSSQVVFKKLVVLPKQRLSYQYHNNRSEFWYVEAGQGVLTLNDDKITLEEGSFVLIKREEKHMIECVSDEALVIYEMQCGECDEDDIVRLEDKYGRIEG
jgi:mannose-6-phosphate isomerase-like protein (cupin superfamily)